MISRLRRLARALVLSVPPAAVRKAQALGQDLRGLPSRLRDPGRRSDPWAVVHNVGGGDWRAVGEQVFATLVAHGRLTADAQVLDIGCGDGRVARPLAGYLSADGGYVGFDVSRRAVEACRRRFADVRPDFRFAWADLKSAHYSPGGSEPQDGYRFPAADGSLDLVFATSVFTHTALPVLNAYAAEACRVLKPGGRLLFTAYLWTDQRAAAVRARTARLRFHYPWRGSWVVHPRDPESAVAHPAAAVMQALADAGLGAPTVVPGAWAGEADGADLQDLIVARR